MSYTVLFIGAHPDDIEIGAGATVAKLVALGWSVYFCILTTESDPEDAQTRKAEALCAASTLGVERDHVFFVDLPDGELKPQRQHIDAIRNAIPSEVKKRIDLVFSHSGADAHIDHGNANQITPLVVKRRPIFCYPVVNLMKPREFHPQVFIDGSEYRDRKRKALSKHVSQVVLKRIQLDQIDDLCEEYGRKCGHAFVEPFELDYVWPTPGRLIELAWGLSCKPPEEPANTARSWWIAGFALAAMLAAAGIYLADLPEKLHAHRGAIVLEDFQSGSQLSGRVDGLALGEHAGLKVVVYVLTDEWYLHPWDSREPGKGYALVDEDGSWRTATVRRDHQARRLAILLTRRSTLAPSRVKPFGNADRRLLSRIDHQTALIVDAPGGI